MKILGIDPSYKRIGFAVIENNKLLYSVSVALSEFKIKKRKRKVIREHVISIEEKYLPDKIIIERTRLYSRGFISTKTIIALGSLISTVIDASDLDVYSVDSRSWKARIIGRANSSKKDTIDWVKSKFGVEADEDQADAIAIASYGFIDSPLLRKENN